MPKVSTQNNEILKLLAQEVSTYIPPPKIDESLIADLVARRLGETRKVEVARPDGTTTTIDGAHSQFNALIQLVNEGAKNILLVGPAGSGKTTLAENMATALNLPFGHISLSAGMSESHLLGRLLPQSDGAWRYVRSSFVHAYEHGGVFLLDELDSADANVMLAVNAGLANGVLALPDGTTIRRHIDCYIVGAANTYGRGANALYVGRNALDAATLDRFVLATLSVEYDERLERRLAIEIAGTKAESLLQWVGQVRQSIASVNLRRIASTRLVLSGARALATGTSLKDIAARYFHDWRADELGYLPDNVKEGNI